MTVENILWEPYSYDEMREQMNSYGTVVGLVEVPETFAAKLSIAAEEELSGYCDAGEELYEELAEMVIGNQWCYNSLMWEPTDIAASTSDAVVLKVEIEPDLD